MVLLCHDISDIMMEAAKLCKYAGLETASTALFVGFMVTWLLARLTYYPFWIIRSTLCAFLSQSLEPCQPMLWLVVCIIACVTLAPVLGPNRLPNI